MLCKLSIKGTVNEVTGQPRASKFRNWLRDLNDYDPQAHDRIKVAMHIYLDRHPTATARDIAVMGPDDRWHIEFDPIHIALDHGGPQEETHANAGKFLGLILWEVMLERIDEWHLTKYPKDAENEDYFVTHYYSIPAYIHQSIAEREHRNLIGHGRRSPGAEELARRLTEKSRGLSRNSLGHYA